MNSMKEVNILLNLSKIYSLTLELDKSFVYLNTALNIV